MALVPSAVEKRAQQPLLVTTWSLAALTPELPLRFPVDPGLPASPKTRYRSAYQPPDPGARPDPARFFAAGSGVAGVSGALDRLRGVLEGR